MTLRAGLLAFIGLILVSIGLTGRLGSVFGAIIDPASMTGYDPHQSGIGGLPTSGTLDAYQIGQYWYQAETPYVQNKATIGLDMPTAIAICLAESGGDTGATNYDSNGTVDRGLWQINSVHSEFAASQLFQPAYNASAAVSVYLGSGWNAWTTFQNQTYRQYLNTAQNAATQVIQDNGG